jgi:branched-chain amino acid transport system substrate-binding protein
VPGPSGPPGRPVAALLPLTGPHSDLGTPMLQAAQLALADPGSPQLLPNDTTGTPQGAAAAAKTAIGAGAGLIIGPLTGPETLAASSVALAAGVPMLAFTNDSSVAKPGVWALGITPAEQARRLVIHAQEQGRSRFAALLPDNAFGRALAGGFAQAAAERGLAAPDIHFHGQGMHAITAGAREASAYDTRYGPIEKQIKEARMLGTPEGRAEAAAAARGPVPPPPFDALLLADTGDALAEVVAVLKYDFVNAPAVQFMGPDLWASPASGSGQLPGAWYAAPDPTARDSFVQAYTAKYGAGPPGAAALAYDAASIARALSPRGYGMDTLTAQDGFSGVDGWFRLLPDGRVRRALAVFQISPGGPQMVSPPPPPASSEA